MKKIRSTFLIVQAILLVFCCFLPGGCGRSEKEKIEKYSSVVFAMDTVMEITVYGDEVSLKKAENLIKDLEEKFSVTLEESDIYRLNSEGSASVSEDSYELLNKGKEICERTGGVLDLTVYPIVRAWGFTTGEYRVPGEDEIGELLKKVDYRQITLGDEGLVTIPEGVMADLGSVAKGYTGDRLMELFRDCGITSALINLGGNVQALGTKPDGSLWKVAIADPGGGEGYAGVVAMEGKAVITSGAYERFFEENGHTYHHIIDTSTGCPAESGFVSVTVIGEEGVLCDGLSTSLFAMGPEKAFEFWRESNDFEAVFITSDDRIFVTEGTEGSFTPLGRYKNVKPEVLRHDQN